jgi:hypothetical protein
MVLQIADWYYCPIFDTLRCVLRYALRRFSSLVACGAKGDIASVCLSVCLGVGKYHNRNVMVR